MKISIFCLTFLFGFLTVEYIVSKNEEKKVALKTIVESNQTEIIQYATEPPCKKYFSTSDYDEIREELRLDKLISDKRKTLKSKKLSGQKLEELKAKIEGLENAKNQIIVEQTLRELRETLKNVEEREQGIAHNLLYIVNCAEY